MSTPISSSSAKHPPPPLLENKDAKRQKLESPHSEEIDYTGIFSAIIILNTSKDVLVEAESLLLPKELSFALSEIDRWEELKAKFEIFLPSKISKNKKIFLAALEHIYVSSLNNSSLKQELVSISSQLKELQVFAKRSSLEKKFKEMKSAGIAEMRTFLGKIQQLRPFLDKTKNQKLLYLAKKLINDADPEIDRNFQNSFRKFFEQIEQIPDLINQASQFTKKYFAIPTTAFVQKKENQVSDFQNGEFSIYAMPLADAFCEIILKMGKNKPSSSNEDTYMKANEIWDKLFSDPKFETVEWMDLIYAILSKFSESQKQQLLLKLAPHNKAIQDVESLDEQTRKEIREMEKNQMKTLCLEALLQKLLEMKIRSLANLKNFFSEALE